MRRELRPIAPITGRPYMAWGAGLRSLREAGWIEEVTTDMRGPGNPVRSCRVTALWNVTPAGHKIIETLPDTFKGLPA
jgi:predicted transcriptional regulator